MKKHLLILFLLVFAFIFSFSSASAESELEVDYQTTKNSIHLQWESSATSFKLYSGKKLLWSGTEHEYMVKKLTPKKQHKFLLVALDNSNKIVDQAELRIITKGEKEKTINKSNKKQKLLEGITIDAIIKNKKVIVKWDKNLPDEDGIVELYKNDQYLGKVSGHQYIDTDIEQGKYYTYRVIGKKKRSEAEIKQAIKEAKESGWTLTSDVLEELSYDSFDLGKIVKTFTEDQINNEKLDQAQLYSTAAFYPQRYNFRYTTFIPDAVVKIPLVELSCPTFRGDNRGFSISSNKYRTRTEVSAYFNGTSNPTTSWVTRAVGQSARYNCDGTTDYKTQTDYTMTKTDLERTSTFASWSVVHAVGDPFDLIGFAPPVIDYTYTANVSYDGDIQIFGEHDQAPAHEMYAYIPESDAILTIFQHNNKGLQYLSPLYEKAKIEFMIYN